MIGEINIIHHREVGHFHWKIQLRDVDYDFQGVCFKPFDATLAISRNLAAGGCHKRKLHLYKIGNSFFLLSSNEQKLNGWIFDLTVIFFWKEKECLCSEEDTWNHQRFLALAVIVKNCEIRFKIKTWCLSWVLCLILLFSFAALLFSHANLLIYLKN